VSRNDGSHEFSETLAEHERAVDRYQRHRAGARGDEGDH
jgi:cell division protein YceG involved in septum cleavage